MVVLLRALTDDTIAMYVPTGSVSSEYGNGTAFQFVLKRMSFLLMSKIASWERGGIRSSELVAILPIDSQHS